jgi:hypothetical protein
MFQIGLLPLLSRCLMMEAASISETSVNFYYTTLHNNPGDNHLYIFLCENLNSHLTSFIGILNSVRI